jgi:ankyrin repeat protein
MMDTAWEDAVKRGDVQVIRDLLAQDTDIDARDRYGQTALMLAAHAGHREVVKALIAHRANLNITAKFGLSALMLALVAGHAEIARLLAVAGADLSLRGTGSAAFADKTAYDLALECGMLEVSAGLKPKPHTADEKRKLDVARCAEYEMFKKIDAAFRAGDLAALREAVDDPANVPNGPMPLTIGTCLEYAIYHSPLPFIQTLLETGADPNPADHAGFPPLIAALSCSRSWPGSPGRPDVLKILKLLLAFKSDPNQRGINDYTPLHMAVSEHNLRAVEILLQAGADPRLRTRIDSCETPQEMAEEARLPEIAELLAVHQARLGT